MDTGVAMYNMLINAQYVGLLYTLRRWLLIAVRYSPAEIRERGWMDKLAEFAKDCMHLSSLVQSKLLVRCCPCREHGRQVHSLSLSRETTMVK